MKQPLKFSVMQVLPALGQGGVERGTVDVAKHLVSQGHASFVVSHGGPLVDTLEQEGTHHICLPVHTKNPLKMILNAGRLWRLIRRHHIQVVHVRSRAPAWSVWLACKFTRVPWISTFHGAYNFSNPVKKFYNSVMTWGQVTIAVSDYIRHHIRDHYFMPSLRVYRGVDMDLFDPARVSTDQLDRLRQDWNLPLQSRVLLMPGRLSPWKGQMQVLEACAPLLHQNKDLMLVFVGSAQGRQAYEEQLHTLCQQLAITPQVRWISHCDQMPAAYTLSSVVLHASLDPEAFGRTVAEAQAMERWVIASPFGGPQEIIVAGQTGFLIDPQNLTFYRRAIEEALGKGVIPEARTRVNLMFSMRSMLQDTLQIYEDVIQGTTSS